MRVRQLSARVGLYVGAPSVLLVQLVGCGEAATADGPPQHETAREAVHGPIPNLLARVVEAPSGDHALCDARVRGISSAAGGYRAALTLTIQGAPPLARSGTVSESFPTFDDGQLSVKLDESPPGSGEFRVQAALRQPFSSATIDSHDCTGLIEADTDGDLSFETQLMAGSASASLTDQGQGVQDANSVRLAGQHLLCRWRLHIGPRSDLVGPFGISAATTTDQGPDVSSLSIARGAPMVGPILAGNGGTLIAEWVTPPAALQAPSLEARFDYFPLPPGSPANCELSAEDLSTATPLAMSQTTINALAACAPNEFFCSNGAVRQCNAEGTASVEVEVCAPPTECAAGACTPPFRVAFIARQGLGADAIAVLALIGSEGAGMVLHQGQFDLQDNPDAWDAMINAVLGPTFPYFASISPFEVPMLASYQVKLADRLANVPGATCTGALGTMASCQYRGVHFLLLGAGTTISNLEAAAFITSSFAGSTARWRICSWNKAQQLMQVGGAVDEVGWEPYEACRSSGAIVATGVRSHYARTHLMSSFSTQVIADNSSPYTVSPGASIAFVSGLGGLSIQAYFGGLETNPWWAATRASNNNARPGALFCDFAAGGSGSTASCYFKDIDGSLYDQFDIQVP